MYKIIINHRNYSQWSLINTLENKEVFINDFQPIQHHLFDKDIFNYHDTNAICTILDSPIRKRDCIPGVLILQNNKTYGKDKNKLLYKCIPDDIRIPSFLIPYEMKKVGFSKSFSNLYVTFHVKEWSSKHPQGILDQVIGPIDVLENFYEYQLCCKQLNDSIQKFNKQVMKKIQSDQKHSDKEHIVDRLIEKYILSNDRTNEKEWQIFSIDPEKSVDFDDAFSIKSLDDKETVLLSIYIANVPLWIDYLECWEFFSDRISTIYLPDKKRSMLPTILSDCLCSLQENKKRIAFTLDLTIRNGVILSIEFSNTVLKVTKNHVYEDPLLLKSEPYQLLLKVGQQLNNNSYTGYLPFINDSHELVSYFMILMNHFCAKNLYTFKNGIFRCTSKTNSNRQNEKEVSSFIPILNHMSGKYVNIEEIKDDLESLKHESLKHESLNLHVYVHITSPIRRLVDLLNMIQMQKNINIIHFRKEALSFYDSWTQKGHVDKINCFTKSLRKVQNECELLHLCSTNPQLLAKSFEGVCFEKMERENGLNQYSVYLTELKLITTIISCENWDDYEKQMFQLYYFNHEEKFKKKIRLQWIPPK